MWHKILRNWWKTIIIIKIIINHQSEITKYTGNHLNSTNNHSCDGLSKLKWKIGWEWSCKVTADQINSEKVEKCQR